MKKEFRTFIAFTALALSAAALPSMAAELETFHITVPFTFTAGKATLPAGDYIVSESENHILTIAGKGGGAMVVVWSAGTVADAQVSALTFARTSAGNMLKEVNMSGHASDLAQYKSPVIREREK